MTAQANPVEGDAQRGEREHDQDRERGDIVQTVIIIAAFAAAAIAVPHPLKGEAVVIFAVVRDRDGEASLLREEIIRAVTSVLGKALKPEHVELVQDLPRTRNGKILRRLIRARYLHLPLGDLSSLENPAALEQIAAHTGAEALGSASGDRLREGDTA